MKSLCLNFSLPASWQQLTSKQLAFVYRLLVAGVNIQELKLRAFLKFSGTVYIGRNIYGLYMFSHRRSVFALSAGEVVCLLSHLDYLGQPPATPVRIERAGCCRALPADFEGVSFEKFIVCDNLYQGFLHTRRDDLLNRLIDVLYPRRRSCRPPHSNMMRICAFYWMMSLKTYYTAMFPNFFVSASSDGGNLLGSSRLSVQEAMNTQLRALTKGDVTKESEVLALDTLRALTELDAQAREYKELKTK